MPRIAAAHGYTVNPELGVVYGLRGRIVGSLSADGYVYLDGRRTTNGHRARAAGSVPAHRLLWEAVNGPIPPGKEINHKNGIKTDNRVANLEVVTRRENVLHAFAIGLKSNVGTKHPSHVLTDEIVREIRRDYRRYSRNANARVLAARYGVGRRTVAEVVEGSTWSHVSTEAA